MYYIPNIIRETSEGLNQIPIQDILFQRREVECIGEITGDSVAALILQLRYLHHEAPEQEITMYINSPGGEVSSGLALYDVMKAIQCPIRTVCVGTAASMAAILFLSGDKRDRPPGRWPWTLSHRRGYCCTPPAFEGLPLWWPHNRW